MEADGCGVSSAGGNGSDGGGTIGGIDGGFGGGGMMPRCTKRATSDDIQSRSMPPQRARPNASNRCKDKRVRGMLEPVPVLDVGGEDAPLPPAALDTKMDRRSFRGVCNTLLLVSRTHSYSCFILLRVI